MALRPQGQEKAEKTRLGCLRALLKAEAQVFKGLRESDPSITKSEIKGVHKVWTSRVSLLIYPGPERVPSATIIFYHRLANNLSKKK